MKTHLLPLLAFGLLLIPHAADARETPSSHQVSAYLRSGATAFIGPSRTMGGMGVGLGVRDVIHGTLVVQADVSYLGALGHATEARVGVGLQRSGVWSPGLLLTGSLLLGERLSFRSPEQPDASTGPLGVVGLSVSPLRFCAGGRCASVLEVGAGLGMDGASTGPAFQLGLLEVGFAF
jgi:hypothetical protein